jgi:hypothetical protein
MPRKIKLLLAGRTGATAGLRAAVDAEWTRLHTAFPGALSHLTAIRRDDPELVRIAAAAFDEGPQDWSAMLEVRVGDEALLAPLIQCLAGLSGRLAAFVDSDRSTVMLGTEHVVIPGGGPIFVLIANRRLPHLTHEKFLRVWEDSHAPFTISNVPPEIGMRYRQFHNDPAAAADVAGTLGLKAENFDGAAECYYRDEAALRELMGRTAVVDLATEDERTFVDHHGCVVAVFDIVAGNA